jgi:hypothetical protein
VEGLVVQGVNRNLAQITKTDGRLKALLAYLVEGAELVARELVDLVGAYFYRLL